MSDNSTELSEAMTELCQDMGLSKEQQYEKVIQALIRMVGAKCVITPHDFFEKLFLDCNVDALGNIHLTAPKTTMFGING
jgi:hypothetical protein